MTGHPDEGERFCSACRRWVEKFASGPGRRPNSRCPRCQALERHRFLALLLAAFQREIDRGNSVLEVAPTAVIARILKQSNGAAYIGMDIDPKADGRRVQVVADLTAAPFRDGQFDVVLCFHVFEHIPDDRSAMREYARVLSSKGIGFIQNPWRSAAPTDEDPHASSEERVKRFGQADHVRVYGKDFEDRLLAAGVHTRRIAPEAIFSRDAVKLFGLKPHPIWFVHGVETRLSRLSDRRFNQLLQRRLHRVFGDETWPPQLRASSDRPWWRRSGS